MRRESHGSPLVLRTVYLPQRDDERLRGYAFRTNRSKNDLIREAVSQSLDVWEKKEAKQEAQREQQREETETGQQNKSLTHTHAAGGGS
jgi:predicted transcriptional regulator